MKRFSKLISCSLLCLVFIFLIDADVTHSESITVDCRQENIFDNGNNCNWNRPSRCCCWCPDPTGAHAWGHVMDLGKTFSNVEVSFEIRPGAGDVQCKTTGYMYYSLDGISWTLFWSQQNLQGWTTYSGRVTIRNKFRYVRANTDNCSVDWCSITVPALSCDADHLNLCITEANCTTAGGNWCSGVCQAGECTNQPPVIDFFTANSTSGDAPLDVTFTCQAHDPDGSIASYRLDYGDGTSDSGITGTFTHSYSNSGSYHATCTVVDDNGASTTSGLTITPVVSTATKNVIPESWVTHNESRTSEYASDSSVAGSVANTYDEDVNTYRQWYVHHGGDGRASATLIITDTWASPRHIDKIKTKAWGESDEGNYEGWKLEFNTYLLIGGTWTQVDRGTWASHSETRWPGYNEGPTNVNTSGSWDHHHVALYDRTIQSGWDNVTGMRVRVYSGGYSYEGDRQQRLWTRIYEMQAFAAELTTATQAATNITLNSATLNGNITDTGGNNADKRGFEWGTSPGSYSSSWTESGSFGAGAFSHNITGLNPNTTYYFRAKAHNSAGWSYGSEISFTTKQSPVIDSFTADPRSGAAPLTVSFTCTAHDPDGIITSYQWDFDGDGNIDQTTTDGTAIYTYGSAGTYQAKVTVVDNYGAEITSEPVSITVGLTVPGDCNGDGTVSIDEIQKAINCFLGKQNACCDKCDLNSNGTVSIDEVQKVINAFLGK